MPRPWALGVGVLLVACGRIGYQARRADAAVDAPVDMGADGEPSRDTGTTELDGPLDGPLDGSRGEDAIVELDRGTDAAQADGDVLAIADANAPDDGAALDADAPDASTCGCSLGCVTSGACREVIDIAVGASHACALGADGLVFCWGSNDDGQLGTGGGSVSRPTLVSGLTGVIDVAAGTVASCAIIADRTVRCWGSNAHGALGVDPAATPIALTPVGPSAGVTNARAIAIASEHACIIDMVGDVFCWGQLATAFNAQLLSLPRPAVDLAVGEFSSLVLTDDDRLHEWDTLLSATGPTSVVAAGGRAVVTSVFTTCYVDTSGAARCRGLDDWGQLGNGPPNGDSLTTFLPTFVTDATSLSHNGNTGCALRRSGALACWGGAFPGDGRVHGRSAPLPPSDLVLPPGFGPVEQVSSSPHGGNTTCVRSRTRVACFGSDSQGVCGRGATSALLSPTPVPAWDPSISFATAPGITCGAVGGTLACSGASFGSSSSRGAAIINDVPTVTTIPALGPLSLTDRGGCGIASGSVTCFGGSSLGELGAATAAFVRTLPEITDATEITYSPFGFSCATTTRNTLTCWGTFPWTGSRVPPTELRASGVVAAAASGHLCVVTDLGAVECIGINTFGETGDGTMMTRTTWGAIPGVATARGVAVAPGTTIIVHASGGVSFVGRDLGRPRDAGRLTNTSIDSLTGVRRVLAGDGTACAEHLDDSISCWGTFPGDGTTFAATPTRIATGATLLGVASGGCLRRSSSGGVECWGDTEIARFGDGAVTHVMAPTLIAPP